MKYRSKVARVDPSFDKEVQDIIEKKVKNGTLDIKDLRKKGTHPRITKAMVRASDFPKLKEVVINAKFIDE